MVRWVRARRGIPRETAIDRHQPRWRDRARPPLEVLLFRSAPPRRAPSRCARSAGAVGTRRA